MLDKPRTGTEFLNESLVAAVHRASPLFVSGDDLIFTPTLMLEFHPKLELFGNRNDVSDMALDNHVELHRLVRDPSTRKTSISRLDAVSSFLEFAFFGGEYNIRISKRRYESNPVNFGRAAYAPTCCLA
jgi:hypothetical protein